MLRTRSWKASSCVGPAQPAARERIRPAAAPPAKLQEDCEITLWNVTSLPCIPTKLFNCPLGHMLQPGQTAEIHSELIAIKQLKCCFFSVLLKRDSVFNLAQLSIPLIPLPFVSTPAHQLLCRNAPGTHKMRRDVKSCSTCPTGFRNNKWESIPSFSYHSSHFDQ